MLQAVHQPLISLIHQIRLRFFLPDHSAFPAAWFIHARLFAGFPALSELLVVTTGRFQHAATPRRSACCAFSIGLLGEHYGWVPGEEVVTADLLKSESWLTNPCLKSVTKIIILHDCPAKIVLSQMGIPIIQVAAWDRK